MLKSPGEFLQVLDLYITCNYLHLQSFHLFLLENKIRTAKLTEIWSEILRVDKSCGVGIICLFSIGRSLSLVITWVRTVHVFEIPILAFKLEPQSQLLSKFTSTVKVWGCRSFLRMAQDSFPVSSCKFKEKQSSGKA